MKKQPDYQCIEDGGSSASTSTSKAAGGRLSEDEVLRRLFAPASNAPGRQNQPTMVIVSHKTERAVSRTDIEQLIAQGVEQLKKHGVKEGDKVTFFCENSPELYATILACWSLNAMAALIDYRAPHAAVLAMSKKLGANLLVTSKNLYKVFLIEAKLFEVAGLKVLDISDLASSEQPSNNSPPDLASLNLDAPAFAILTSGTTGTPKTAVHNLGSLAQNLSDLIAMADLQGELTALTPLPISHIFGLTVFLITQLLGITAVLPELDPDLFVESVRKYKPQLIAALPQFYGKLLSASDGIDLDDAQMLLCGGAPITISLARKFEEKFGKRLNNGYGSTESKIVALNKDGEAPPLSIGKPISSVKIEIVDEQDQVVPEGKNGEVRISGPMLMIGYLDNEEETQKVLRDGHYYTGDLGRFEDGNLFIAGRKKDVIKVAGVVVHAAEVEEALRNHPAVKDVAVTPVENKRLGEVIKATVVLVDDGVAEKLTSNKTDERQDAQRQLEREFRAFCKQHLSRYKRPMKWDFPDPHEGLPKTLAGKVDKKAVKAQSKFSFAKFKGIIKRAVSHS